MKKNTLLLLIITLKLSFLNAQNKIVLIEQFTNSSCPPCAQHSPVVYDFANNHDSNTTVIAYHTSFPYNNDSMNLENPVDVSQRVSYYGIPSVPYSIVDGNVYSDASASFTPNMSTIISNRSSNIPKYSIENIWLNLNENELSGSFKFISQDTNNANENLTAHIVVIEKDVLKSAYAASPGNNAETHYEYVMRKMFPNANGTLLINKNLNNIDTLSLQWNLNHIKDIQELRVIAFVQNNSDKEIYQTQVFTPQIFPLNISEKNAPFKINIFPNPAQNKLFITLPDKKFIHSFEIINQLGELVFSKNIHSEIQSVSIPLNLNNGIYFIKMNSIETSLTEKIIVKN